MTIGFPQPRVRALLVASILVLSGLAGCSSGGSAKMRAPTAARPKKDMARQPARRPGRAAGHGLALRPPDDGDRADRAALQGGRRTARRPSAPTASAARPPARGPARPARPTDNVGTCIPADVGTDPRTECDDQGSPSCGTDGNCDGTGACENYVAGVACQTAGCTGSTLTFAGRCDGARDLQRAREPVVLAVHLRHDGAVQDDLLGRRRLHERQLLRLRQLWPQAARRELRRRHRLQVDPLRPGRLLRDHLHGQLQVVRVSGSAGTCINVPAGQDPLAQCADQLAPELQDQRLLRRQGRLPALRVGHRLRHEQLHVRHGDGGRQVRRRRHLPGRERPRSCNAYVCDTTGVCKTTCTVDADCATGYFCIGGSCAKKTPGTACAADSDCGSSHCAQGVCCNNACTGTCMSCALTATNGTCTPVAAGADPLNQCADVASTNPCGTNGSCNGAGRLSVLPGRHDLRRRRLVHRLDADPGADLRRRGHLPGGDDRHVRSVRVRHGRLQDDLLDEHRLRLAQLLRRQQLRQAAAGRRPARRAPPARRGSARRASAATPPARGPACRARSPASPGPARPCPPGRRRRPPPSAPMTARHDLRHRRNLQRRRRLPQLRRAARCAPRPSAPVRR